MIEEILTDLKFQVSEQEELHGPIINPDLKDGIITNGVLLSVRQTKILIDFIESRKGKNNG